MLKKKLNKKGFSLIELIIVIAIMAILAAIIVPTVINKVNDANKSAAQTEVSNIATAIQQEIVEIQATSSTELTYLKKTDAGIVLKNDATSMTEGGSTITLDTATAPDKITITNTVGDDTYTAEITISTRKVEYNF